MKVTISDKELTQYIREAIEEKDIITESDSSLNKDDVKTIVKKEIKDFLNMSNVGELDKKVQNMVLKAIKDDKELNKHFVEISKNVLVQLYKTLWTKHGFWSSDLKNVSA